MTKIKESSVLITGGASGIGKLMGRIALEKGARCLIIWDINEKNIDETKKEFQTLGRVEGFRVDVSDFENVKTQFEATVKRCGNVDILINCAGIITGNKTFDKQSIEEIDRTMSINAIAPMYVTHAALPGMIERNCGHICNIASAGGMLANPNMSVYAASKWAVIGWSDSMRIELSQAHSNVHITTVAPYYINTGMFDGVKSKVFPILKPEPTARKIMRAIEHNTDFKGLPWSFHFIRLLQGLLPTSWFDTILGKWCGIYGAMDHFTGRKKVTFNQTENGIDNNTDRNDRRDSERAKKVLQHSGNTAARVQKDSAA